MLNHSNLLDNEVYRSEPFIIHRLRRFTQIVGREQLNQSVEICEICGSMCPDGNSFTSAAPLLANSRGLSHEIRIANYFGRILRG